MRAGISLRKVERLLETIGAGSGDPNASAAIADVLWGNKLRLLFPDPTTDSRALDLVVLPAHGTKRGTKIAPVSRGKAEGGSGEPAWRLS